MDIDLGINKLTLPFPDLPELPDFSDLVKKQFEGILAPVAKLLGSTSKKVLAPLIDEILAKLKSFMKDLAFVGKELLDKTKSMGKDLIDKILESVKLIKSEIVKLVDSTLIKVKEAAIDTAKKINKHFIVPLLKKIDDLKHQLVEEVKGLIDHAMNRIDDMIDQGDIIITATIDTFRSEALRYLTIIPWDLPWSDNCREELNIQGVIGPQLKTGELYDFLKCKTLKRFDEEKEIKNLSVGVIQTLYADLQDRAWHLACASRGTIFKGTSSALKIEAIEDWIEFGQLHQLWNQFGDENMSILDAVNQKLEELDTKISQFESKIDQLDELSANLNQVKEEVVTAQSIANNAVNKADSAQKSAENAQATGGKAISGIEWLEKGIKDGSIVVQKAIVSQKALMLRARNDNHWLRCNGTDSENHDCFGLWTTDNKWYNLIRVGAMGALPRESASEGPAKL